MVDSTVQADRFHFNKGRFSVLRHGAKVYYVHDTGQPGLCLCVSTGKAKTFYLRRKTRGKSIRHKLGPSPALTVERAREAARSIRTRMADGIDLEVQRAAERFAPTFQRAFEDFLAHAKHRKATWREDARKFHKDLGGLARLRLSHISRADVTALHLSVEERSGKCAANRLLSLVRSVFNHAIDNPASGCEGPNPASRAAMFPEESRDRFPQPDELRRFFQVLAADGSSPQSDPAPVTSV